MTTQPAVEPLPGLFSYVVLEHVADTAADSLMPLWLGRAAIPAPEVVPVVVSRMTSLASWGHGIGWRYGEQDFDRPSTGVPDALLPDVPETYRLPPFDFEPRVSASPEWNPQIDLSLLEPRLTKAVSTIEAEPEQADQRIEALVRDETVQRAQYGYQDAIRSRNAETGQAITGYRRGTNPDCCELCFWLWKEGYVYDIDQPMHRHKGCRCWPVPTTDRGGKSKLDAADQTRLADYLARFDKSNKGDQK